MVESLLGKARPREVDRTAGTARRTFYAYVVVRRLPSDLTEGSRVVGKTLSVTGSAAEQCNLAAAILVVRPEEGADRTRGAEEDKD